MSRGAHRADPSSASPPSSSPPPSPPSPSPSSPPGETAALAVLRRFELRATAVRALAAVAVLVALGAGVLAWRSRPSVQPVESPTVTATPAMLVVAVAGQVQRPGLVTLPVGARVADAIEAAGGVLPGTDLGTLNLARKLVDGELVTVGVSSAEAETAGGLVNLNTATVATLQTLPGVGPVLAQRIIDYREQHGGFASVDELRRVTGIGEAKFAELQAWVTV